MPLSALAPLFTGYVGKDYQELIFVIGTILGSMIIMVALGAWWQR